ncbi:hypothetical protein [Metapseudomonas otitidis]|uniref:hypothetical protein n=1 Tax=Metapseudomonas otitidis TaxID=319939 RepID=UPI001F23B3AB|nr:hypothetical protein [Pseudomonas otitidis]
MTFQRESRYIVVKLKDLAPGQEADIREHLTELSAQPVDSLVIERDWPEYEPAWRMIQARVEGAPLSPAHIEDEREAFNAEYDAICSRPITHREIAWRMWQVRAALSAPPAAGVIAAHRLIAADGSVMSDWVDGPPPSDLEDLCGIAMEGVRAEVAYSAPPAAGVPDAQSFQAAYLTKRVWELSAELEALKARPLDDDLWDQTLTERDDYHKAADALTSAIAKHFDQDFGEHSNLNDPWANAVEFMESATTPPASEQQHGGRMPSDSRNRMWELIDAALLGTIPDGMKRRGVCNILAPLFASEHQTGVVIPETVAWLYISEVDGDDWDIGVQLGDEKPNLHARVDGEEFQYAPLISLTKLLRLNPHLAKGEGV